MRVLMLTPQLPSPERPGSMAPTGRQIQSLRELGVDVRVIEMRGMRFLKYATAYRALRRQLHEADLIHAHYGYCGWLARTQLQKPIVLSFMGSDLYGAQDGAGRSDWLSAFMAMTHRRWLAPRVDAVIVKSREMADLVMPTPSHVIANGINSEIFQPMELRAAREKLRWNVEGRYVLFPGNPQNPNKGYALARETMYQLNPRLERPAELVALWNVPPDEVPLYMNACDAMLMVSRTEGSPNVVKEALACNTPIVSVPVGDVASLLEDVAACVVCERDAAVLANTLRETLLRGERSNGRDAIERLRLDMESVARRVVEIYQEVFAARGLAQAVQLPGPVGSEASS